MHDGRGAPLLRHGDQHLVLQVGELALFIELIGKRGQVRQVGHRGGQQVFVDVRVGVTVDGKRILGRALVGDDQGLARVDQLFPAQDGVVAVQLPQGDAVLPGNGGQGVPRGHGVGLAGHLHHLSLIHISEPTRH